MIRLVLPVLLCCFMGTAANATHIIGGEMQYDRIGDGQYQLVLKLYRYCSGADFDALAPIGVFDGVTGALVVVQQLSFPGGELVPITLDSPCLTLPPNICVESTSYTGGFSLPANPNGYVLAYQRCCRTGIINNLLNPGNAGITVMTRIPGTPNAANNSARFNALPPIALCLGAPLSFDHSASDPDGDSLVYSLCTPFDGADFANPNPAIPAAPPYAQVSWSGGYSEGYPIDSSPAIGIDPVTGMLTLTPTLQGNFTVGVMVQEYRNGLLLNETRRDFLFKVVACDAQVTAAIVPQPTSELCDDLTITFGNASAGSTAWQWDFGVPGTNDDASTLFNPTFTFPAAGSYPVTLIANPGSTCADTVTAMFTVNIPPVPFFNVPPAACGTPPVVLAAEGMYGPNAQLTWQFGNGAMPATSTDSIASVAFPGPGSHAVTLTIVEGGCVGTYTATVVQYAQPVAAFDIMPASPVPLGTTLGFTDASQPGGAPISQWAWAVDGAALPSVGVTAQWEANWPGAHLVTMVVVNAFGCTDTAVATIVVSGDPIRIPNVFSPNGDGSNDLFVIENIQYYPHDFTVYSRWGTKVLETRNYKNDWSGAGLPDGTYYFVLRMEDGVDHSGHITLLR
jgi:gliding motility-associated-like protein